MKKIISFILILICLTSLCSCDRVKEVISQFEYTEGLSTYVIEDDQCIVSVGEDMRDIEVVNVPREIDGNRVVAVDKRGFAFLDNLRSVRLPKGVYHIGDEAFMYSFSLETVELPAGVTHIGRGAFSVCRALKSISLSEGLLRIEERTFYFCESLTEINLPRSLTYIGTNAFTCCGFTELTIPEGTQSGSTFAVKGRGIPYVNGKGRGDLLVTVNVEVPKSLSKKQRRALEDFAESCDEKNYPKRKSFSDKIKKL